MGLFLLITCFPFPLIRPDNVRRSPEERLVSQRNQHGISPFRRGIRLVVTPSLLHRYKVLSTTETLGGPSVGGPIHRNPLIFYSMWVIEKKSFYCDTFTPLTGPRKYLGSLRLSDLGNRTTSDMERTSQIFSLQKDGYGNSSGFKVLYGPSSYSKNLPRHRHVPNGPSRSGPQYVRRPEPTSPVQMYYRLVRYPTRCLHPLGTLELMLRPTPSRKFRF